MLLQARYDAYTALMELEQQRSALEQRIGLLRQEVHGLELAIERRRELTGLHTGGSPGAGQPTPGPLSGPYAVASPAPASGAAPAGGTPPAAMPSPAGGAPASSPVSGQPSVRVTLPPSITSPANPPQPNAPQPNAPQQAAPQPNVPQQGPSSASPAGPPASIPAPGVTPPNGPGYSGPPSSAAPGSTPHLPQGAAQGAPDNEVAGDQAEALRRASEVAARSARGIGEL